MPSILETTIAPDSHLIFCLCSFANKPLQASSASLDYLQHKQITSDLTSITAMAMYHGPSMTMAMYHQYRDLPQIPTSQDELQYAASMQDSMDYRHHVVHIENNFDYNGADNNGLMRMPVMERFLVDSPPLTPGLLHAKLDRGLLDRGIPLQRPQYGQYEPWPRPEIARYNSPGETSVSGNSSYATQNEVHSPPSYYLAAHDGPEEFVRLSFSYSGAERMKEASSPPQVPATDRSICLRQLELEPAIDEAEAVEMKTNTTSEQESPHTKSDSPSDHYKNYSDSGVGSSVRDAESVQPMSEEETSDADYTPNQSARRRRSSALNSSSSRNGQRRRSYPSRSNASVLKPHSNKVKKRNGRTGTLSVSAKTAAEAYINGDTQRHFPCPLASYGCQSTFSSKNEWKRHVSTQHIKLGFWRCNLCATTIDPHDDQSVYHNDFNRKDLFTQHLRRMHAAPSGQSIRNPREYAVTEENIAHHQKACFRVLRGTPTQSCCLYCNETFSGPNSWENRMEHIGRHLEKDRKTGLKLEDVASWRADKNLERWLLDEGIIAFDKTGEWKIGDGRPRRRMARIDEESEREG